MPSWRHSAGCFTRKVPDVSRWVVSSGAATTLYDVGLAPLFADTRASEPETTAFAT
jgi:hypothetical protein